MYNNQTKMSWTSELKEERIGDFEDRLTEIIQSEQQREKRLLKKEHSLRDIQDYNNICNYPKLETTKFPSIGKWLNKL